MSTLLCSLKIRYETSSWGWDLALKRSEMAEDPMRYIIIIEPKSWRVVGFASFQFTKEETMTDAMVDSVYWYFIHGIAFIYNIATSYKYVLRYIVFDE
jgi:hypothetical protein